MARRTDGGVQRLGKSLGLFDVYVICTGAMFSSGFFLLPGIAYAHTGPSVVLAYLLSALLILPALFSKAELSTAMPKAGGTYYFLDRTMGPLVGTIAGGGTWIALSLKTAFALIGMGAYLAIFFPGLAASHLTAGAIALALLFGTINVLGAKETTGILRVLVTGLLTVLAVFIVSGLATVASGGAHAPVRERFRPFLTHGVDGLLETVGLVFISYVGLTKVASVAEEVEDPDRNIPLGMLLSLATVTLIYVLGVFVMVAVIEPDTLRHTFAPVADAAAVVLAWLPGRSGVLLVLLAAIAAFASMANAGLMSASRYPLAMSRDRLLPAGLAELGRFGTPTRSVLATTALLVAILLVLDVEKVAKMASALQLLIFALVNLAVILMRESGIEAYDPGFRSPLYPWLQIVGIGFPFFLIAGMGWFPSLGAVAIMLGCTVWYLHYGRARTVRTGAIYHIFHRLGQHRFEGLDVELRGILRDKGLRHEDPYDDVVARAFVIELEGERPYEEVVAQAAELLATRIPAPASHIAAGILDGRPVGLTTDVAGVALPHVRLPEARQPEMVLVRSRRGLPIAGEAIAWDRNEPARPEAAARARCYHALIVLASPQDNPGQHLRILAQLATHVSEPDFLERWQRAPHADALRETLLRDDCFLTLHLEPGSRAAALIGKRIRDLDLPPQALAAVVRRGDEMIVPRGPLVLEAGDRVTFIGEVDDIEELYDRYHDEQAVAGSASQIVLR